MPSVLWCCWFGGRKGIWPVKTKWWGTGVVICLQRGAMICIWSSWCHCHPITSCYSKIQNGLPFWCRLTQDVLEKKAVKRCSSSSSRYRKNPHLRTLYHDVAVLPEMSEVIITALTLMREEAAMFCLRTKWSKTNILQSGISSSCSTIHEAAQVQVIDSLVYLRNMISSSDGTEVRSCRG